jgi:hypothetical protein
LLAVVVVLDIIVAVLLADKAADLLEVMDRHWVALTMALEVHQLLEVPGLLIIGVLLPDH